MLRARPRSRGRCRRAPRPQGAGRRSAGGRRPERRASPTRAPRTSSGTRRRGRTRAGSCPGDRGATRLASSSTSSPGPTAASKDVRGPSQTIGFPSGSSQWYESCMPSRPDERQDADPAFASRMRARLGTPARCSSSAYPSQRTASGPAGTGCSPTRCMRAYSRRHGSRRDQRRGRLADLPYPRARDAHAQGSLRPAGTLRGDRGAGAQRRLARGREGRGSRADRTQRLGQDDAPSSHRRNHQAERGHHLGGRPYRLSAGARRGLPRGFHGPRERLPERRDPGSSALRHHRAASTRSSRSPSSRMRSTGPCARTRRG